MVLSRDRAASTLQAASKGLGGFPGGGSERPGPPRGLSGGGCRGGPTEKAAVLSVGMLVTVWRKAGRRVLPGVLPGLRHAHQQWLEAVCASRNAEWSRPPRPAQSVPQARALGSGGRRAICFPSGRQSGASLHVAQGPASQVGCSANQPDALLCRNSKTTTAAPPACLRHG